MLGAKVLTDVKDLSHRPPSPYAIISHGLLCAAQVWDLAGSGIQPGVKCSPWSGEYRSVPR